MCWHSGRREHKLEIMRTLETRLQLNEVLALPEVQDSGAVVEEGGEVGGGHVVEPHVIPVDDRLPHEQATSLGREMRHDISDRFKTRTHLTHEN